MTTPLPTDPERRRRPPAELLDNGTLATVGDLAAPDAWLDVGQRQRLEAALRGRRLDVVLPAGGRGRALRMRRAPA
jgi:hypothetical protein